MAWPGNHYSPFWEHMNELNNNQSNGAHGAGVDHAPPPPPPELPQFLHPEMWDPWSYARQAHAHAAHAAHAHGPHAHGPHAHAHSGHSARGRGHAFARRRGRRHGRGGSGEDEPAERQGGPATDKENDEAFPPEYITDDEVLVAAAAEVQEKGGDNDRSGSPDTMMRDDAGDPPEEVPNPNESPRHRGFGRHGHRGRGAFGRGGSGHEAFGPHRRGGRHGPHHHHGGGPGSFGGASGGGPGRCRSHGPHGKGHGGHARGPPPSFLDAFFGPPHGGPHHGPGPHHHHRGPPPPPGTGPEGPLGAGPFDLRGMVGALSSHPYAQQIREFWERSNNNNNNNPGVTPDSSDNEEEDNELGVDSTTPPLDLFELADRWVLHLAVPGAKKEDVGVHWDADRSMLRIAGVVHRPGDETFLQSLVSGERRVGVFSREVKLPPPAAEAEEKTREEVDGEGIAAKMEDGVLVVTVPKVERDWTAVKRVEIQ